MAEKEMQICADAIFKFLLVLGSAEFLMEINTKKQDAGTKKPSIGKNSNPGPLDFEA